MKLHRIYVEEEHEASIRFWMTEDQKNKWSSVLTFCENCYIISLDDYVKLTGAR